MKFTFKRSLVAASVGIAAVVTPLALTVALTGTSGPEAVAGATGTQNSPDQILFGQTTGTPSTFYEYVPGNGSATTTQAVSSSGSCGSPTVSDPNGPLLAITAKLYAKNPNSNFYANAPSPATVGASGQATGVCDIPPAWSIENKANKGAEALDFSLGSDKTLIGANRAFTDAQIPIQRKDSGVAQPGATVQLVEFDSSGNQLASQTCTIGGGQGTQITADTNGPGTGGNCTGTTAPLFNTVEVRNLTTSTSVSVVGPVATFTLGSVVCGGSTIQANASPGAATAQLTLNEPSTVCKTYSAFTSTTQNGAEQVEFDASGSTDLQFTVQFLWPAQAFCTPDGSNGTTMCAPDTVSYSDPVTGNTVTNQDQTYCAAADLTDQLCTVTKNFNYNVSFNGGPGTQITETWSGDIDWHIGH
jgi:hypothetical protein